MEIDKNQPIQLDTHVNQVQDRNRLGAYSNRPRAEKAAIKTDTVHISETAKRIQETKKQLEALPDVREEKVAELKRQIENGTYRIDAEKLAAKMIKDALINEGLK